MTLSCYCLEGKTRSAVLVNAFRGRTQMSCGTIDVRGGEEAAGEALTVEGEKMHPAFLQGRDYGNARLSQCLSTSPRRGPLGLPRPSGPRA